ETARWHRHVRACEEESMCVPRGEIQVPSSVAVCLVGPTKLATNIYKMPRARVPETRTILHQGIFAPIIGFMELAGNLNLPLRGNSAAVDDRVAAIPFKITELALRGERRAWELQRLPLRDRAKPLPCALEIRECWSAAGLPLPPNSERPAHALRWRPRVA